MSHTSSMSPAGVGASPDIIAQALRSELSPIGPTSPYSWEQDDFYDPNEALLERFVINYGLGTGIAPTSPAVLNTPLAGARTPVYTGIPVTTQGATVGVGSMALSCHTY